MAVWTNLFISAEPESKEAALASKEAALASKEKEHLRTLVLPPLVTRDSSYKSWTAASQLLYIYIYIYNVVFYFEITNSLRTSFFPYTAEAIFNCWVNTIIHLQPERAACARPAMASAHARRGEQGDIQRRVTMSLFVIVGPSSGWFAAL